MQFKLFEIRLERSRRVGAGAAVPVAACVSVCRGGGGCGVAVPAGAGAAPVPAFRHAVGTRPARGIPRGDPALSGVKHC